MINLSFLSLFQCDVSSRHQSHKHTLSRTHTGTHKEYLETHTVKCTRPNCHLPPHLSGSSHSASLCLSSLSDAGRCCELENGKGPGRGCTSADSSVGVTPPMLISCAKERWRFWECLTRRLMIGWNAVAGVCDSKCGG